MAIWSSRWQAKQIGDRLRTGFGRAQTHLSAQHRPVPREPSEPTTSLVHQSYAPCCGHTTYHLQGLDNLDGEAIVVRRSHCSRDSCGVGPNDKDIKGGWGRWLRSSSGNSRKIDDRNRVHHLSIQNNPAGVDFLAVTLQCSSPLNITLIKITLVFLLKVGHKK